jgi:hypothetical protein
MFDFGLSRFIPQNSDAYEEVYALKGAGNRRYILHQKFSLKTLILKADVYSFSVVLWEMIMLKKPFQKYKHTKDFEQALSRVEKSLV